MNAARKRKTAPEAPASGVALGGSSSPFGAHVIALGDVLARLRELPSDSFDALLCDPPYGFKFMGKRWDYDVPSVDVWRECLRVLKPGAPLLAFGGARTFHRIAAGIEDAGFELRDVLMWLYGKGFPKSQNVALAIDKAAGATREVVGTRVFTGNAAISTAEKGGTYGVQVGSIPPKTVNVTAAATPLAQQWDGYGTALKPAYEPIILARKPLAGTMAENVAAWGSGGLAIDACRIEGEGNVKWEQPRGGIWRTDSTAQAQLVDAGGRWPANLLLDEDAAEALDAHAGTRRNGGQNATSKRGSSSVAHGGFADSRPTSYAGDSGGPSRFFYTAKVSTREREAGCDGLPQRSAGEVTGREDDSDGLDSPRAGAGRTGGARNHHPTLKPLALTRWLASLIKPPTEDATLLIPYSGAGSEMIGALQAGWPAVFGIEGEAEYIDIAEARIAHWGKGER